MQLIFFVPPNEELEIAPPKMKVKGYMYPQMKKPVGMLLYKTDRTLYRYFVYFPFDV